MTPQPAIEQVVAYTVPVPKRRGRFSSPGGAWRLTGVLIAVLTALPLLMLLPAWLTAEDEVCRHLADTLLVGLLR